MNCYAQELLWTKQLLTEKFPIGGSTFDAVVLVLDEHPISSFVLPRDTCTYESALVAVLFDAPTGASRLSGPEREPTMVSPIRMLAVFDTGFETHTDDSGAIAASFSIFCRQGWRQFALY